MIMANITITYKLGWDIVYIISQNHVHVLEKGIKGSC